MILIALMLPSGIRQTVACEPVSEYLAINPTVHYDEDEGCVRYLGDWSVVHTLSGHRLRIGACYTCALKAARVAVECDVDWGEVKPGRWWTKERQAKVAVPMDILLSCQHIQAVET